MSKTTLAPARRLLAALAAGVLVLTGSVVATAAPATAAERTFALVGSLQDELGCPGDWQPDCAVTELQATDAAGVFAAEFELPAGSYEYKVAVDDTWDEAYGLNGGADNIPLTIGGPATLRFVYDDTTHRVGLEAVTLRGGYGGEDDALVAAPVRQPGSDEQFYFALTDRFANGDTTNDTGGSDGDRLTHGFDPADRGFYHGGDIAGLRENLDYIKGLGTTAIWLTPSFMNRPVQGTGADASAGYHGYWITDFTRIDPHLGTNEELKALIDEAHADGIKVYFDIITNHTADVIGYAEGAYGYVDQATSPYLDASGAPFDPADYAGTGDFPALDAATSFPYTPVVGAEQVDAKTPEWLNDPTLYHNRGNSTWEGESVTLGDFDGLDDLMTEHPRVVDGFVDVYQDWIDLGIDGFRIDTAKHVNFEFWQEWSAEVLQYARDVAGKPEFFMFGEVYDADPAKLAPYVRDSDMNSVLDFTFQSSAAGFASGNSARGLQSLYAGDDRYTTPDSSATALPTFLGNHDMGRVGYLLQTVPDALERDLLAHELMFLGRGQPVVYYGDEQGFAGTGGDKGARQSLFASETAEYRDQALITGETAGAVDRYDTTAPIYQHIAALAQLRADHPALATGAQIERYADSGPGVYAFSRVDRDEKVEYLVALNNTAEARTVELATLTADASFAPIHGVDAAVSTDAAGVASVVVPALSAVVYRADATVTDAGDAPEITVSAPAAGATLAGSVAISADVADAVWQETSFSWRVVGSDDWQALGTAEDTEPRVFHDIADLAAGTLIEYRAVTTDASGDHGAASTYASVGNSVSLEVPEEPESPIDSVTVAGSLNSEMGCAGDWAPGCEAAGLDLRADGVWAGTFDLPAGDYEYKIAVNGSWDVNYGAGGVPGGANIAFTHAGGAISFYFDPRTNIAQSTAEGPIVTLPGSAQSELGCAADWMPECLVTLMADADGDGVYEFQTDALPAGAYETKVAHGLSWDENYGVGGAPGGGNYAFTVGDGELVTLRYTLATHILEIGVANPPLAGAGELRAHWIDADTIAWPADLGSGAADATWQLHASPDAAVALVDGEVTGGDAVDLERVDGGLTDEQAARFPALAGFIALRVPDAASAAELLRGQVMVSQRDATGVLSAFTGVQIPGALDDLYADETADAELGIAFQGGKPTFRLWAPTAQSATLLTWDAVTGHTDRAEGTPQRHEATWDAASGVWTVAGKKNLKGDEYVWEVVVYAPSTGAIETNLVTDPYSVALTTNSVRSVAVDLDETQWRPRAWERAEAPVIDRPVDRAIYELHVRDFSITDESVPEAERGTYRAFTRDSAGTQQLRQLADAGINTVHLLPTFDIATIEENRALQAVPACDLEAFGPASPEQQACIEQVVDADGFNWGYDPYHFSTPEGSYAVEAEGGARVHEFREMVGALHGMGLQVVLDQVFNHTAQSGQGEKSVLDQVVPGYYHRLNLAGGVETSTCCQNVATEHDLAEKLMVDSVVLWAREYKVDGFRFDLMGHHSKANMLAVREALDALTVRKDGVDGSKVYLYGEGWNFGEVADDALFDQARQGQLGGTGIGTFSDRLRDAVHGGSPVAAETLQQQGFGTGLATDPNGAPINGTPEQALADLAHQTDLVKLGLAGNLRDFTLTDHTGAIVAGDEIDYRGSPAGYAEQPDEIITYVDAHDNETLYDLSVLKLPADTPMADRVRMNTLSLATTAFAQTPSFWHAGTELLRSKSLDRNSYNSGDWFNRIDWTGQESTFGSGLPRAADNEDKWPLMAPLLSDPALKPAASDIAAAEAAALDLLRVRDEVGLLRLGSGELIAQKVTFPGSGPDAAPGSLVMFIDDQVGSDVDAELEGALVMFIDDQVGSDVDAELEGALVAFNASPEPITQTFAQLAGRSFALTPALADGADAVVKTTTWDAATGTLTVPARSAVVLVQPEVQPVDTTAFAVADRLVIKAGQAATVSVRVVAADRSAPVGTVSVSERGAALAAAELTATAQGRVSITVPGLRRGAHLLRVAFDGGAGHADSWTVVPVLVL